MAHNIQSGDKILYTDGDQREHQGIVQRATGSEIVLQNSTVIPPFAVSRIIEKAKAEQDGAEYYERKVDPNRKISFAGMFFPLNHTDIRAGSTVKVAGTAAEVTVYDPNHEAYYTLTPQRRNGGSKTGKTDSGDNSDMRQNTGPAHEQAEKVLRDAQQAAKHGLLSEEEVREIYGVDNSDLCDRATNIGMRLIGLAERVKQGETAAQELRELLDGVESD